MDELLQKQREELMQLNYDNYGDVGRNGDYLDWHTASIKQVLEALMEREEKCKLLEVAFNTCRLGEKLYYNKAKQETISYLQEQIGLIK